MNLKTGSFCTGIAAPECAWKTLGWKSRWFSEIDPFASAVLAARFGEVPNLGDMEKLNGEELESVDVVCAGTPCQSFSVAGLRKGMADPRGNLALVFLRLIDKVRPRWLVWENVPGILSSGDGRDFGAFLGALGELRYGWAYRVLDAQYFGVPQRRRRVFVVGCLGDWRCAAAVLFERHSLSGDSPPSREARSRVARSLKGGTRGGGGQCSSGGQETLIAFQNTGIGWWNQSDSAQCLRDSGLGGGSHANLVAAPHAEISPALKARDYKGPSSDGDGDGAILVPMIAKNLCASGKAADALTSCEGGTHADSKPHCVDSRMRVRRLTPLECERLQGLPDGWTAIQYRGKPAADGPRYRAIGNSMAVPVLLWIGRRIEAAEMIRSKGGIP